jgi:hypothetical protein
MYTNTKATAIPCSEWPLLSNACLHCQLLEELGTLVCPYLGARSCPGVVNQTLTKARSLQGYIQRVSRDRGIHEVLLDCWQAGSSLH